jgi:ankyrin repeat protein
MKRIAAVCSVAVCSIALVVIMGVWFTHRAPALSPTTQHLYQALKAKDVQAVSDALAQGADVNAHDELGFTPLVWATINAGAVSGHPDTTAALPLLLDKGADINAPAVGNETALIVAVKTNNPPAVNILLDRKADTSIKNVEGKTALAFARAYRLSKIAAQLEAAGAMQ